jgi:hypothetical protein
VQPPEALGFGMTVLSRTLEYQHSGKVELDGQREGLDCRLVLPLSKSSAAKWSNSSGTEAAVGTFIRMHGPPCAARSKLGFSGTWKTQKLDNRVRGSAMGRVRA